MNAILSLIEEHYNANRKEVKAELEMRHGEMVSPTNLVCFQTFSIKGEDFALAHLSGEPVIFVTVNWGDPSVKFSYL